MIIVTGSLVAKAGHLEEALKLSLAHVERSRAEPGCISHSVYRSVDDPHLLFFFEEWADDVALAAHFAVPASRAFIKALAPLVAAPPSLNTYQAQMR
jgi:quinol monooxygenase YgiN